MDLSMKELEVISREDEMAEWIPQQVMLFDNEMDLLLVRATCRLWTQSPSSAHEFLHIFACDNQLFPLPK